MGTGIDLSFRDRAILRAVATGHADMSERVMNPHAADLLLCANDRKEKCKYAGQSVDRYVRGGLAH